MLMQGIASTMHPLVSDLSLLPSASVTLCMLPRDERLMALGGHNMTVVLPHERVVDSSTVAELLASPEMMLRIAEVPTSMVTD